MKITVPISVGDFIDRYSILQIKAMNGLRVYEELVEYDKHKDVFQATSFNYYLGMFVAINEKLWKLEDAKRNIELIVGSHDYVEIAELITHLNDLRYQIKKSADKHFGSEIQEKKSHEQ
jgi:hypothetical protein